MSSDGTMFNSFAPYYELMIDWDSRLAHEGPFFQRALQSVHARRVLDCACGTGQHACQFARWGLEVSASDVSQEMVEKARHLAESQNLPVDFKTCPFEQLSRCFDKPFDAVLCIGNSLSAGRSRSTVREAVGEMHKVMRPDGTLVLQAINYERLTPGENSYGNPVYREHIGQGYLFLKNMRRAGTTCDMDIIVMQSTSGGQWSRTVFREKLLVLDRASLVEIVESSGFGKLKLYGGYEMTPFDARTSRDLIIVARRE